MELKTVGLTKEFGSKIAVDDLNITIIIFTLWFCLWWRKKSYGASVVKTKSCEEQLRK